MKAFRLASAAVLTSLLLTACPSGSQNTQSSLTLQALAVTQYNASRQLAQYDVFLAWNAVPRATSYDVLAGASPTNLNSITPGFTPKTTYTDPSVTTPGASQSYQIRALDVNASELIRSNIASVQMLSQDASLSAPAAPTIVGATGTGLAGGAAPSAQPTLTWAPVPDATAYYLTLAPSTSPSSPVFAVLVSTESATIGTILDTKLSWPGYAQIGSGYSMASGTTYSVTLAALKTNTPDLSAVSGIDVGPTGSWPITYTR